MSRRGLLQPSVLLLLLSLVGVGTAAEAPPPLSDAGPVLEGLGKQLQDRSRPEAERLQILQILAEWGTPQVREPLLAVLDDPLPSIRAAAASALGWPDDREAVAALRQRVEAPGETPAVRAAALEALGRIGDDSVRPLVLAATRDPDAAVRGAALWGVTLGKLVAPADHVLLLRQLAEARGVDLRMRCRAIQTLGALKDTGSTELLIRLLEHEPRIPTPPPSDAATQQEVMLVRYREVRDVRAWAAKALGLIDARSALPLLVQTAEDPQDFFLRLISLQALGSWKTPEAIPVLVRRLQDPVADVRRAALSGLSNVGDRSVLDHVVARLSDKNTEVRVQAIVTLGDLGDPRARPELEALQRNDPAGVVQDALEKALVKLPR